MARSNRYENDCLDGVLPVFKGEGMTSHDVVAKIRRMYGTMRVGHTGTLDPMATGVLVVLIGRAAKAAEFIEKGRKHYRAILRLGVTTDTEDIGGTVLSEANVPEYINTDEIEGEFTGEISQRPPMYSAIKINGQKMVDLARNGITVDIPERKIQIFSLKMTSAPNRNEYILDVECSAGTYIRTLCADIGKRLGCGGTMAALCRTENSGFTEKDCHTLQEIDEMTEEERTNALIETERLFSALPEVKLSVFFASLAKNGNHVYQKKIGTSLGINTLVRLCDEYGFFSLGKVIKYDDESVIKPIKKFRL